MHSIKFYFIFVLVMLSSAGDTLGFLPASSSPGPEPAQTLSYLLANYNLAVSLGIQPLLIHCDTSCHPVALWLSTLKEITSEM